MTPAFSAVVALPSPVLYGLEFMDSLSSCTVWDLQQQAEGTGFYSGEEAI